MSSKNSRSPDLSFLSSPGAASVLKNTFPETQSTSGEEQKPNHTVDVFWVCTRSAHRRWRGDAARPRNRYRCPWQGLHQTVSPVPFPSSITPRPDPWGPVRLRLTTVPSEPQRCAAPVAPHLRSAEPSPHLPRQEGLQPAARRAEVPPGRRRHLAPPHGPQQRARPASGWPYRGKLGRGRFTAERAYHRDGGRRSEGL